MKPMIFCSPEGTCDFADSFRGHYTAHGERELIRRITSGRVNMCLIPLPYQLWRVRSHRIEILDMEVTSTLISSRPVTMRVKVEFYHIPLYQRTLSGVHPSCRAGILSIPVTDTWTSTTSSQATTAVILIAINLKGHRLTGLGESPIATELILPRKATLCLLQSLSEGRLRSTMQRDEANLETHGCTNSSRAPHVTYGRSSLADAGNFWVRRPCMLRNQRNWTAAHCGMHSSVVLPTKGLVRPLLKITRLSLICITRNRWWIG